MMAKPKASTSVFIIPPPLWPGLSRGTDIANSALLRDEGPYAGTNAGAQSPRIGSIVACGGDERKRSLLGQGPEASEGRAETPRFAAAWAKPGGRPQAPGSKAPRR